MNGPPGEGEPALRPVTSSPAAPREPTRPSRHVLDPMDRVSEILFALIMVLTFTGSLSVAQAGRDDVRAMLIGALGCNLAWGIIDAVFYLMACMAERGRDLMTLRALRNAADPSATRRLLAGALPPAVAAVLQPAEIDALHRRLKQLPEPPQRARWSKDDALGALGVFLLVFLATFPVVIPFIFMQHAVSALRVSNAIAVAMLFSLGYAYARTSGRRPWLTGVSMVVLGITLVGITIALGG